MAGAVPAGKRKALREFSISPDGATIHFTKMKLFQEGDTAESGPSGPERDICAVWFGFGHSSEPGGVAKVETNIPPDFKPHPGFLFVTSEQLHIVFAE